MKKRIEQFIKTYFYFNKSEKKGIYLLLGLIILVLCIKWSLNLFFPQTPVVVHMEVLSQLDSLEAQAEPDALYEAGNERYDTTKFHKKYNSEKFKPYPAKFKKDTVYPVHIKKPLVIVELNTADSQALVALYKIGPSLASKIINYRNRLGGFMNLEQLTEIWGFDPDLLYDLEGKIWVDASLAKKINLNTTSFEALKTHPYFKINLSQAIVNYRKQHGNFQSINDLKKIKLVNDSILLRISPYCYIE